MKSSHKESRASTVFDVEPLEGRTLLFTPMLPWTTLHEFGHSLGLGHINNPNSIMNPYFTVGNNYDLANFANDPAVATLQTMYSSANVAAGTTPWKDNRDGATDGVIRLTYSFMPDGTVTESQRAKSALFARFNSLFGSPDAWKPYFVDALTRWADVSNGVLTFTERADAGKKFDYVGLPQNDPYSGDIRIGTHAFDGPGAVIAHAYSPATGGNKTGGGDAHFDEVEEWDYGLSAPANATSGNASSSTSTAPAAAIDKHTHTAQCVRITAMQFEGDVVPTHPAAGATSLGGTFASRPISDDRANADVLGATSDDLGRLAANVADSVRPWTQGNINSDHFSNLNDSSLLSGNLGQSTSPLDGRVTNAELIADWLL